LRVADAADLVVLDAGPTDAAPFINHQRPDCGIQAGIDSLGDEGGEVMLPAGRFELLRSLALPSRVQRSLHLFGRRL
jgi:hypothetical protein